MTTTRNPERLSALIPGAVDAETRDASCFGIIQRDGRNSKCGATFTQTRIGPQTWTPFVCPGCTAVREQHERDREAEAEKERARANRQAALRALNVPLIYSNATLEAFRLHGSAEDRAKQSRVLQLARRYLTQWPDRLNVERIGEFPTVVIFRGTTGSGKGHVAWSIAKHVAGDEGGKVIFRTLADCILDLREPWRKGYEGDGERQRLARYRDADLLVVDEVSVHAVRGEPAPELYAMIAERETWLRPTILTTNESPETLAQLLGPALESRAIGYNGLWNFGDADYRVERRNELRGAA